MDTVTTIAAVRERVRGWRAEGRRVAFVPTMGNLHAGHLSLIEAARRHGERFVASIFVNPMQFGPNEDFAHYPRTPREDERMLTAAGCDLMFMPEVSEIYPHGAERATRVEVPALSRILEGEFRPGHFEGVSTVVAKLFHIVEPDVAVFGEKDFQQLTVIRRMVAELCMPVEILAATTVRDADGLAMSSRNQYLTAEAPALPPQIISLMQPAGGGAVLLQRPLHVLAHQVRGVRASRLERPDDLRRARGVTQRHGEIAQPALVADAVDGRATHALLELRRAPAEQLRQRRRIQAMAHLEIRVRGRARELVPRTHQLAVVTAVDAIADRLAQLNRNGAVVLDGEVGDAAPRVQPPGGDDRTGGAGGDARLAAAAVGAGALIHRQRQVRQDLAEKEPRAPLARDEVGVLADPAEPGIAGQRLLEHRRRVHAHPVAERSDSLP